SRSPRAPPRPPRAVSTDHGVAVRGTGARETKLWTTPAWSGAVDGRPVRRVSGRARSSSVHRGAQRSGRAPAGDRLPRSRAPVGDPLPADPVDGAVSGTMGGGT